MQKELKPGEIRTAELGAGCTVEVQYVAGGSFVQVAVKDNQGRRVWGRNYWNTTSALVKFDVIVAALS